MYFPIEDSKPVQQVPHPVKAHPAGDQVESAIIEDKSPDEDKKAEVVGAKGKPPSSQDQPRKDTGSDQSKSPITLVVEEWSAQEVKNWFKGTNFAKYAKVFEQLDGKALAGLSKEDFLMLVDDKASAIALFNAIQPLKQSGRFEF